PFKFSQASVVWGFAWAQHLFELQQVVHGEMLRAMPDANDELMNLLPKFVEGLFVPERSLIWIYAPAAPAVDNAGINVEPMAQLGAIGPLATDLLNSQFLGSAGGSIAVTPEHSEYLLSDLDVHRHLSINKTRARALANTRPRSP